MDKICVDVPLFIRILEFAREDAKNDLILHDLAERAIKMCKDKEYLKVEDYNCLVQDKDKIHQATANPPHGFKTRLKTLAATEHSYQTILKHLGGNKFIAMTGAKDFVHGKHHLQFRLPRGLAKNKASHVIVRHNARDLYDMEFHKIHGIKTQKISEHKDIGAAQLQQAFTHHTGLDTHL